MSPHTPSFFQTVNTLVQQLASVATPLSKELEDRLIVLHTTDKYAGVHKAVEEALQQLKI